MSELLERRSLRRIGLSGMSDSRMRRFLTFVPIGDTGMKLVAVMPQSEAFASLYNVIKINILILVLALVAFVFLITLILQSKIIKPLGMMMQDAQKVAEGDLSDYKVQAEETEHGSAADELDLLRSSFDTMVGNLRELILRIGDAATSLVSSSQQLASAAEQSTSVADRIATTTNELAKGELSKRGYLWKAVKWLKNDQQLGDVVKNVGFTEELARNVSKCVRNGMGN